jgi:hypothetical protein
VTTLEQMAPEVASRAHAADVKAEEDARRQEEAESERARAAAEKRRGEAADASRKEFLQMIEQWATAERVEAFCQKLAERAQELEPKERETIERHLAEAVTLFGGADVFSYFRKWRTPEQHFRAMPLDYWEQVVLMRTQR